MSSTLAKNMFWIATSQLCLRNLLMKGILEKIRASKAVPETIYFTTMNKPYVTLASFRSMQFARFLEFQPPLAKVC